LLSDVDVHSGDDRAVPNPAGPRNQVARLLDEVPDAQAEAVLALVWRLARAAAVDRGLRIPT